MIRGSGVVRLRCPSLLVAKFGFLVVPEVSASGILIGGPVLKAVSSWLGARGRWVTVDHEDSDENGMSVGNSDGDGVVVVWILPSPEFELKFEFGGLHEPTLVGAAGGGWSGFSNEVTVDWSSPLESPLPIPPILAFPS